MPSMDDIYVNAAGEREGWPAHLADTRSVKHEAVPVEVRPDALMNVTQEERLQLMADEIGQVTNRATDVPLASQTAANYLAELLARGKVAVKDLDHLRRTLVDPLNARVKEINGKFKPLTDRMDSFEHRAKRLLLAWQQYETAERERLRQEALRKQEEAARREAEAQARALAATDEKSRQEALAAATVASQEQMAAAVEVPHEQIIKGFATDTGTASVTERWTFEVVDAALVPRSFCIPDVKAIRNAVNCGTRDIPGVAVMQEASIQVRTR